MYVLVLCLAVKASLGTVRGSDSRHETAAKASEVSDAASTAVYLAVSQALYSGLLETL